MTQKTKTTTIVPSLATFYGSHSSNPVGSTGFWGRGNGNIAGEQLFDFYRLVSECTNRENVCCMLAANYRLFTLWILVISQSLLITIINTISGGIFQDIMVKILFGFE